MNDLFSKVLVCGQHLIHSSKGLRSILTNERDESHPTARSWSLFAHVECNSTRPRSMEVELDCSDNNVMGAFVDEGNVGHLSDSGASRKIERIESTLVFDPRKIFATYVCQPQV
jgi:hypothetical protein